jgi:uncharacterized membrane protein
MAASPRPLVPEPDPRRVVGVDVARALALLGMMATHMLPGRIGFDVPWPQQLAGGRASALFAVLAGVSVALVSGRERPVRGRQRYAAGVRLGIRALLIGVVGLGLGTLDSGIAVILTYYAVLFVIGLPFLGLGPAGSRSWPPAGSSPPRWPAACCARTCPGAGSGARSRATSRTRGSSPPS